jgi:tryptophan 2,3-dioxygenase
MDSFQKFIVSLARSPSARSSASSYAELARFVQKTGKHFLGPEVTAALIRLRALMAGNPLGSAVLDCVLDKDDSRYAYGSYLALPVLRDRALGWPGEGSRPESKHPAAAELPTLLIADLVWFELGAAWGWHDLLPEARPPLSVTHKRVRLGARYAARNAVHADIWDSGTDSPHSAARLIETLPKPQDQAVTDLIISAMLPVYINHDEYMFIRILQCYEIIFAKLTENARRALQAVRSGDPSGAQGELDTAAVTFNGSSRLFSLLATMNPQSFRHFREFTDGASAIQSEQYKKFELLCGMPPASRLESASFAHVPEVQRAARAHPDSITRAYLERREAEGCAGPEWEAFLTAAAGLERAHQRWKTTHHRLARRMLGDLPGSGYTAGVPYLERALGNRLFWQFSDDLHSIGSKHALT